MAALLALVPLKDWIYGGIIAALLAGFGWYTVHERHEGAAHEAVALKKSSDELAQKAQAHLAVVAKAYVDSSAKITENLNAQIDTVNAQHDSDIKRLQDADAYRRSHASIPRAASTGAAANAGVNGGQTDDSRYTSLERLAASLADDGRLDIAALNACTLDRDSLTGKP